MTSTSSKFDRVRRPDPTSRRDDVDGKEALYSTSPEAEPTSHLLVLCRRCDVEAPVQVWEMPGILIPPVIPDPFNRRVLAKCPTCRHRAWLEIRQGQALRALLGRVTS